MVGGEEFQRSADRRSGERRFPCCLPISLARGSSGPFLQDSCFYSSWGGGLVARFLFCNKVALHRSTNTQHARALCFLMFGSGVGWYTDAVAGQSLPYLISSGLPTYSLEYKSSASASQPRLVLIGVGMAAASVPPGRRLPPRQLSQGTSVPSPRPPAPPRFSRILRRRAALTGVIISLSLPSCLWRRRTAEGGHRPPSATHLRASVFGRRPRWRPVYPGRLAPQWARHRWGRVM